MKQKIGLYQIETREQGRYDKERRPVGGALINLLQSGNVGEFLSHADINTIEQEFKKNPELFYKDGVLNNFVQKISSRSASFRINYTSGGGYEDFIDTPLKDIGFNKDIYDNPSLRSHYSDKMWETTPRQFISDIDASITGAGLSLSQINKSLKSNNALSAKLVKQFFSVYLLLRKKGYSHTDLRR